MSEVQVLLQENEAGVLSVELVRQVFLVVVTSVWMTTSLTAVIIATQEHRPYVLYNDVCILNNFWMNTMWLTNKMFSVNSFILSLSL